MPQNMSLKRRYSMYRIIEIAFFSWGPTAQEQTRKTTQRKILSKYQLLAAIDEEFEAS